MSELSLAQVQAFLATVSYKPGWTFEAYEHPWEWIWVNIVATMPDAYHPGQSTDLGVRSALPPMHSYQQLTHWLAWRLGQIELHEMREFLRVDGVRPFDPHRPHVNDTGKGV